MINHKMQEATKQKEDGVIRRTIDSFIDNYRISINDRERAKTDRAVKDFLSPLGPERYEKFLGYYEKHKSDGHE